MRVLVLGGTSEASALARRLADTPGIAATLSLAGRTRRPAPAPIPVRTGGFGGIDGLAAYLREERVDAVVDATHPFAARIAANAVAAADKTGVPVAVFTRPPWSRQVGDRWIEVDDAVAAAAALGDRPVRVFLTVGRLSLAAFIAAPQHNYLIRSIDPPDTLALPQQRLIAARGPFTLEAETALLRQERIDVVVSKNSGGAATYAKIAAARALGIGAVLIRRPAAGNAPAFTDIEAVMAWIAARSDAQHPHAHPLHPTP